MKKRGFTLIEVIVVIVLIGMVGVIAVPALLNSGNKSKEALKTAKIESIKQAASNYAEDNINTYSDCNSLRSSDVLKEECLVDLSELVSKNYLDNDKDKNAIIDPSTDEEMIGQVLVCYDMNTGVLSTEYLESVEGKELCTNTGLHTLALQDNSVAISYHDGIDFYTNLLVLGNYNGNFTLDKTEDNGVHFELIDNKKLHVTYAKHSDILKESPKTASVTITGTFNGTETRSVTFYAFIYDKISEEASELSVTIRPNAKLKELGNLKNDITLTCVQQNEYGCEIELGAFDTYFNKTSVQYYEYLMNYSLGSEVTYKSQTYTSIKPQEKYRLYRGNTAPTASSIKDKSVLYINIVPSPKTLTFDAQGGEVNPNTKTVTYGDAYGELPTPTKTGYIFKGWYENTSYTKEITSSSIVEKIIDHTISAKWEAIKYTIAFNGNGNTGGSMSSLTNRVYDTSYTLTSNAYSNTGYLFNGWNTKSNGTGTSYANGASVKNLTATNGGTVTLYAQWTPITYNIKFDGNGATNGSMSNMVNVEYGKSYALTSNAYSKTGYLFDGWNTMSGGTGTSYANEARVSNLTATNGGTVTLYAQWQASVSVTVSGGSSSPTSTTVRNGNSAAFTITPDSTHKLAGSTFTCTNGISGNLDALTGVLTVSNVTASTTCTVTLAANYSCPVGELTYDASKGGYICIRGADEDEEDDTCTVTTTYNSPNCEACGGTTCAEYFEARFADCARKYTGDAYWNCIDAYASFSCHDYISCNRCKITDTFPCTTTRYYCGGEWSIYDGSKSTLRCYKSAST